MRIYGRTPSVGGPGYSTGSLGASHLGSNIPCQTSLQRRYRPSGQTCLSLSLSLSLSKRGRERERERERPIYVYIYIYTCTYTHTHADTHGRAYYRKRCEVRELYGMPHIRYLSPQPSDAMAAKTLSGSGTRMSFDTNPLPKH